MHMLRLVKNPFVPRSKRLSLRVVLSLSSILQFGVVVGLVGGFSQIHRQQTINNLAQRLLDEVHEQTQQHLQFYTALPQQIVQLVADDIELGLIRPDAENLPLLNRYLLKRIQTFSPVSSIYVGNQQGQLIGASSMLIGGKPSYLVEFTDGTSNGQHFYAVDSSGKRTHQLSAAPYDLRRRSWYQTVIKGAAGWGEIEAFDEKANRGLTLTAIKPFHTATGQRAGVIAADLDLHQIDTFLQKLSIAQLGQVFILEPSGALVASSSQQLTYTTIKGQVHRVVASSSDHPLMRLTVEQVERHLGSLNQIYHPEQFSFELQGQRHFVEIVPWQDEFGLSWLIVAVIPESELTAQIHSSTHMTLLLSAIVMLVALGLSIFTVRWGVAPIQRLNQAAKDLAKGKWEKPITIDWADEVGELAQSMNQIAAQLQLTFSALHDSQQQLTQFLEAVPLGICLIKPSGKISYMNPIAQDLLGLPLTANLSLQTLSVKCQTQIAGTGRPYPIEQLPAMRALNGESITVEDVEIHCNNQVVSLEMQALPVLDAEGKVRYAIVTLQNIGNRKQAEKLLAEYNRTLGAQIAERTAELTHANLELERAKQAAETANSAKSAFLANMSHELRTPLNAILGFAQIMGRSPETTPEQQHNLRIINRSGEHLLSLINNLLDLSKIEVGRVDLAETCFNLMELLETIDTTLHQRAAAKGLQFQIITAPDVPRQIISDASKLRQVLINLIGNAIKFTEYGSVILRVKTENEQPETLKPLKLIPGREENISSKFKTQYLIFEVEDTGRGIPTEELNRVFSAFEQTSTGKGSFKGNELGLTISRKIIELMHGTITVDSIPEQGSRFIVKLPIHGTANSILDHRSHRSVIGLAPGQPLYRVLIVDDQSENRELLVRMLTALRLEIREATNGQDAIACCQEWQPHLVLLDIYMPTLNGFATTQQIRQIEQKFIAAHSLDQHKAKIIALSASVLEDDRQKAFASGCDGFLSKPFQTSELYEAIGQQLELRYRYADPALKAVRETDQQLLNLALDEGSNVSTLSVMSSVTLDFMPLTWRHQLYEAAVCCRDEQVLKLLEQIPLEHSILIKQLRSYTDKFQFEMILKLLNGYSREDQS